MDVFNGLDNGVFNNAGEQSTQSCIPGLLGTEWNSVFDVDGLFIMSSLLS